MSLIWRCVIFIHFWRLDILYTSNISWRCDIGPIETEVALHLSIENVKKLFQISVFLLSHPSLYFSPAAFFLHLFAVPAPSPYLLVSPSGLIASGSAVEAAKCWTSRQVRSGLLKF